MLVIPIIFILVLNTNYDIIILLHVMIFNSCEIYLVPTAVGN